MKRSLVFLLAMAVVLFSTNVMAGTAKGKPFVEIQGQFVEVENSVFDLEAEVASLTTRVDSIEDNVVNLENAVINLENENVILGEQIDSLISTAAVNSADIQANLDLIESNEEQLTILRQDIGSNEFAIHDLEHEQEALYDSIVANVEGILSLQSQIDQNIDVMAELQRQIDETNAAIALKADFMSASCPSGQALLSVDTETGTHTCATDLANKQHFMTLSVTFQGLIQENTTRIMDIRRQMADIRSELILHTNAINTNTIEITDLRAQLAELETSTAADIEAQRVSLQSQIDDKQTQLNGLLGITANLQGQINNANDNITGLQQQINDGIASSSSYGLRVATVNATLEIPAGHNYTSCYSHKHSLFGSYHSHCNTTWYNGTANGTVSCPEGTIYQGGGWSSVGPGAGISSSATSGDGWSISAYNTTNSPRDAYYYATCLEVYEK